MYFRHDDNIFSDKTELQFFMGNSPDEGDTCAIWMQTSENVDYLVFSGTVEECERYLDILALDIEAIVLNDITEKVKRYRE